MNTAFASHQRTKSRPIEADDPMPWGKHKGLPIDTIPVDYLRWCLANTDACNPDHDRYWPEFRETLEGLAGPQAPVRPSAMPLAVFVARLLAEDITLSIRGGELVASEELTGELLVSLKAHADILGQVLTIGQDTRMIATGSARAEQAGQLRGLVKRWYNAMSRRFHPDQGGVGEHQVAINAGFEALKAMITEWEANP